MSDRQKIMSDLEGLTFDDWHMFHCDSDVQGIAIDSLNLLKEQQEAVEPEAEILNEIDRIYRCQKCHKAFFYINQRYCDRCGQKVKWDDQP